MDELFKNTAYKILELFLEYPNRYFSIREIARRLNMSHSNILNNIRSLSNLNLLKINKETLYPTYYANAENESYKFYKQKHIVFQIMRSQIVKHIEKQVFPSSIILFGSCAKGEYWPDSDIDLFVESTQANIKKEKYEKILNRKINIIFERSLRNLSKELRSNIINGILLYGYIRINKK